MRFQPRLDYERTNRFRNVVHCTHSKSLGFVFVFAHRCHEDDRDVSGERVGLELLAHLISIESGHHDVKQDEVRVRA